MAKRKIMKNSKNLVFKVLLVVVAFFVLSLIVSTIGSTADSPLLWINIVVFFESVKVHFASYWMFYSLAAVVVVAVFNTSK